MNCYSAWNYKLKDEESTGRIIIPLEITSSGTRNGIPPEANKREIHQKNGIPLGITTS
jgi:hypothetical protein